MQWEFVVLLLVAIPVILFPAALVWFLNVTGLYTVMKEARLRRIAREHRRRTVTG